MFALSISVSVNVAHYNYYSINIIIILLSQLIVGLGGRITILTTHYMGVWEREYQIT